MEIAHAAQCHVQCHFILSRWKQCLVWFPRVPCSDVTFQGFAITSFRRSSTPINSGEPSNFVGQRDYSIHRNVYIYIFSSSHQSRLLFILAVWHHLQHQLILPFFRAWSFYRYFSLSFSLPLFSWQYTRRNIPFNAKPQNFASRRNSCHASHVSPSTHDECLESIRSLPPAINVITFIRTVDNLRLILYLSVSNIAEWFRPIHAQNLFRNFITN